jgi:hypothetical protein
MFNPSSIQILLNTFGVFRKHALFPNYTAEMMILLGNHHDKFKKLEEEIFKSHSKRDSSGKLIDFLYQKKTLENGREEHFSVETEIDIKGKTIEEIKALPQFNGMDVYFGQIEPSKFEDFKKARFLLDKTPVLINNFSGRDEDVILKEEDVDDQAVPIIINLPRLSKNTIQKAEANGKLEKDTPKDCLEIIDAISMLYRFGLVHVDEVGKSVTM